MERSVKADPSRHELGQWFTPEPVAELALRLALGDRPAERVLDPSCGDGAFLRRARALGIAETALCGVDLDPRALARARQSLTCADLICQDFFTVDLASLACDVIVGNPPYVRQERLGRAGKQHIAATLVADWPDLDARELRALVGRSDLAAPFLLRAFRALQAGGRGAMVVSSALLDSSYGDRLWRLVREVVSVDEIVCAPVEHWFADAAVNTVILVFSRGRQRENIRFARLRVPTETVSHRLARGEALESMADVRTGNGLRPETWAAQLRAMPEWFAFREQASSHLVPLGEIAEVRRGITSGANDFFYLSAPEARARNLDARHLAPLLRLDRRSGQRIDVDAEFAGMLVLSATADCSLAEFEGLRAYVEAGRARGVHERPTLAARTPWWSFSARPARVFLTKAYFERFVQRIARQPMLADQRVYCVWPRPGISPELLGAILNASTTSLAIESLGRASMGEGALEWTVSDARALPILDPRRITEPSALLAAFSPLRAREIGVAAHEAHCADRVVFEKKMCSELELELPMQTLREALATATSRRCRRPRGTES